MINPTEFGVFLKRKRNESKLTQDELAASIGKTGQYICNIEKGKNSAPPQSSDIEALIRTLELGDQDAIIFRRLAAADRNQLSGSLMVYLSNHKTLLEILEYGALHQVPESYWKYVLKLLTHERSSGEEESYE